MLRSRQLPRFALALLVLGVVGCDQAAKQIARTSLTGGREIAVGGGLILCLTQNTGAFLSMGSGLPGSTRFWLLTVAMAIVLTAALAYLLSDRISSPIAQLAASLLIGGGASNLLDRVRAGTVTDFLLLRIGPLRTGVFNLADVAITAGAVLLALTLFRERP